MVVDIEGNKINIGDTVYYARVRWKKSQLVVRKVTDIKGSVVEMKDGNSKYLSNNPSEQIVIKYSLREKKLERILDV